MVEISIKRLDPELPLPSYAHPGDAGADLHSAVDLTLEPGERALVPDRASRWRSPRGTSPWCTRARGSPPSTGSRS